MNSDTNLVSDRLIAEGFQLRKQDWNDFITHAMDPVYWRHDETGKASFAWQVSHTHANAAKILHGGAMSTLLDHCMGALVYLDNDGSFAHTMQMSTQFIRPVRIKRWVFVTARHLAGNGHNLILEAEASVVGQLVAKAQGTFVNPVKRQR